MARILVIDDDRPVRTMLRMVLERAGYEVFDAPDGESGLDELRQHSCELVITDIVMPEREGLETIMEVRLNHPGVKIVAISGARDSAIENYLGSARHAGAHRVFPKPIPRQQLLEAVANLLGEEA